MADQTTKLDWIDCRVPVSKQFDDPYFSIQNGLAETSHVFLNGNSLPARFKPGFHIAELGFGTGLNMLATWKLWLQSETPGPLHFTSFEAFPMAKHDMKSALKHFPELGTLVDQFLNHLPTTAGRITLPGLQLNIIPGDARQTLPNWQGSADAWFLDGFSPAKNPELWGAQLMQDVANHTACNGTFATYSAAGHIRCSLSNAGFAVERVKGFAHKRHMTTGRLTTAP